MVEYKYISETQEPQPIIKNYIQSKTEPLWVEAIIIQL